MTTDPTDASFVVLMVVDNKAKDYSRLDLLKEVCEKEAEAKEIEETAKEPEKEDGEYF